MLFHFGAVATPQHFRTIFMSQLYARSGFRRMSGGLATSSCVAPRKTFWRILKATKCSYCAHM